MRRGAVNTSREQVLPTASLEMQCYQPLSLVGELAEVTTGAGGSSDPISQHSYPHTLAVPFPAAGPCSHLVKPPLSNSSSLPSSHLDSCSHQHCSPPALVVCQHLPVLMGSGMAGIPTGQGKLGSPLATVKWGKSIFIFRAEREQHILRANFLLRSTTL